MSVWWGETDPSALQWGFGGSPSLGLWARAQDTVCCEQTPGASQSGSGQDLGRNPATPLPLLLPLSWLGQVQRQSLLGSRPSQLFGREKKQARQQGHRGEAGQKMLPWGLGGESNETNVQTDVQEEGEASVEQESKQISL